MQADTVLLAVGESDADNADAIANTARMVADPSEAQVVVAHVVTQDAYEDAVEGLAPEREQHSVPFPVASFGGAVHSRPPRERENQQRNRQEVVETLLQQHRAVRAVVERLDAAGTEYEVRGTVGDPADRIAALADELAADFVVVGGRDQSAAKEVIFGSVSRAVVRSVDCPVVTVPDETEA